MGACVKLRTVKPTFFIHTRLHFVSWPALSLLVLLGACRGQPDPSTLEGMMEFAASAIEREDARQLFRVIDPRSRHALASIVEDRRAAAELIRTTYPEDQRADALEELGPDANAEDAAELFASRCGRQCMSDIAMRIGAPLSQHPDGDELLKS